ncbi:MAG: PLP-dependent transferase, partial [Planctomycetaceae bacterium]|nr:PLP-dependent transferase [Planctomycetaceae bacterium]
DGTGGIVSFELNGGGQAAVSRFMRAAASIPFAPTLADARTTLSHPASTSHRFLSQEERDALGITDELIRLSIGLEPADLITSELATALTEAN